MLSKKLRSRVSIAATSVILSLLTGCSPHQPNEVRHSKPGDLIPFDEYALPNGLRVILSPDQQSPIVSVDVAYDVGSRNEVPGKTGLAHFCEHMMFKGSAQVAAGEHRALVERVGGYSNADTDKDLTHYYDTVPANQLKLALFLESDRMRGLNILPGHIEQVRREVLDEKRENHQDIPYDDVATVSDDTTYTKFPYQHPTIGITSDLQSITESDVHSFLDTYYKPNCAAIAICGRFDPATIRATIQRYFGDIPRGNDLPAVDDIEPATHVRGVKYVDDPYGRRGTYARNYITVPAQDPDVYPLDLLSVVLAHGDESPLQRVVADALGASKVRAQFIPRRDASIFRISLRYPYAPLTGGEAASPMRDAIDREIKRIADNGVTADQLHRAQTYLYVTLLAGIQSRQNRASLLAEDAIWFNDPNQVNEVKDHIMAVSPADIQRVCRKYLDATSMTEVYTGPNARWADAEPVHPSASVSSNSILSRIAAVFGRGSTPSAVSIDTTTVDMPKRLGPIAPVEPTPLTLPKPISLPNGLKLILCEDHRTPVVNLEAYVDAGSSDEEKLGLANVSLVDACKGVQGLSADAFDHLLADRGITANAHCYLDYGTINVDGPSSATSDIVTTMTSILTHASFPQERVSREQQADLAAHTDIDHNADSLFHNVRMAQLAHGTTYAAPWSNSASIAAIKRSDIITYYQRVMRPNRTILVVTGDFNGARIETEIRARIAHWTAGTPWHPIAGPKPTGRTTINTIDWPYNHSAEIEISCIAPTLNDADVAAFDVADQILARGPASRLHKALRDRPASAYSVNSQIDDYRTWSCWTFGTGVSADDFATSFPIVFKEIGRIRLEPVSAEELADAKASLSGGLLMNWDLATTQAGWAKSAVMMHLPLDYGSRYLAAIQSVTPQDVYRVANTYFAANRLSITVIGPETKTGPTLSAYGQVVRLDHYGVPKPTY